MSNHDEEKNKGFTLVEILLAIFVITILGVAVVAFSSGVFKNTSILRSSLLSQSEIRKTFKIFSKEAKGIIQGFDGAYPIDTASNTSFAFYSNIDDDKYPEKIKYYIQNNNLNKSVTEFSTTTGHYSGSSTDSILVKNISIVGTKPVFAYYDNAYDGTDNSPQMTEPVDVFRIRLVKLNLNVVGLGKEGNTGVENTIQVSLRNLKDNY